MIEAEASRTLAEMRSMVGALRESDEPDLAPQPGIRDIVRLVGTSGTGPEVAITVDGEPTSVGTALDAAVYRLVQESVTNARRHAREASRIAVRVEIDDHAVRVAVDDDGVMSGPPAAGGYGLLGMEERAHLLGGTFDAGPRRPRGWSVRASLPRTEVGS